MAILPNPFITDSVASQPDATEQAAALLPPPVRDAAAESFPRGFDEAAFMAATTLPDLEHAEIIAAPICDPSNEDLDALHALQVLAMRRAS